MKTSKFEIDMCNGSIMDKLISFSLPLMLSSILQLMFNAVDIIVEHPAAYVQCGGYYCRGKI